MFRKSCFISQHPLEFQINRPMSMKKEIIQTRNRKLTQSKKRKDIEQFSQLISSAAAAAVVADHASHEVAQWFGSVHQNLPISPRNNTYLDACCSFEPCLPPESFGNVEDVKAPPLHAPAPLPNPANRSYLLNEFYPIKRMKTHSPSLWNASSYVTSPLGQSQPVVTTTTTTTAITNVIPRTVPVSTPLYSVENSESVESSSNRSQLLPACEARTGINHGGPQATRSVVASPSIFGLSLGIRPDEDLVRNNLVPYSTWPVFNPHPSNEIPDSMTYSIPTTIGGGSAPDSSSMLFQERPRSINAQCFSEIQCLPLTLPWKDCATILFLFGTPFALCFLCVYIYVFK